MASIGWLIPTVGIFGAVRETVEVSNALVRRGHSVTIFHPDGGPCRWLPCLAKTAPDSLAGTASLDVLILINSIEESQTKILLGSAARIRGYCMMGFAPSEEQRDELLGLRAPGTAKRESWCSMSREVLFNPANWVMADSFWQLDYVRRELGLKIVGPAIGGINLNEFKPPEGSHASPIPGRVIASGDGRPRKGMDTVSKAVTALLKRGMDIQLATYHGKGYERGAQPITYPQFLASGEVFADGHLRGGWCNPVAEAMAVGTPVVCTDIGATRDFAIHGETALVVQPEDSSGMARAIRSLLEDRKLAQKLATAALAQIRKYSYERAAKEFELELKRRLVMLPA